MGRSAASALTVVRRIVCHRSGSSASCGLIVPRGVDNADFDRGLAGRIRDGAFRCPGRSGLRAFDRARGIRGGTLCRDFLPRRSHGSATPLPSLPNLGGWIAVWTVILAALAMMLAHSDVQQRWQISSAHVAKASCAAIGAAITLAIAPPIVLAIRATGPIGRRQRLVVATRASAGGILYGLIVATIRRAAIGTPLDRRYLPIEGATGLLLGLAVIIALPIIARAVRS